MRGFRWIQSNQERLSEASQIYSRGSMKSQTRMFLRM
jgi:hypothetical protein